MMRNILLYPIAALAVFSLACGGGPTSPAPIAAQSAATVVTPTPAPAPPTPVPSPDPAPAPAPSPAPAPAPAPDAGTKFTAHVDTIHWYGAPLFGATFELTRYSDRIVFGSVTLPIVFQDERSFIARNSEMTFNVIDSTWTFNGIAGTGAGTLSR
jgi:hypothetical protein